MRSNRILVNVSLRVLICTIVIIVGIVVMQAFASMKKPPAEAHNPERSIKVEVQEAQFKDYPVTIKGYGDVEALNVVSIAPEISGRIVEVHPNLEVGEIIPKGEVLFKIDSRDYKAAYDQAVASVEQLKNSISRLKKQYSIDKERLITLERNSELAKSEFERVKKLFEKNNVGTQSSVDMAEQAYNNAFNMAAQLKEAVDIYPIQIKETESGLASAEAALEKAEINLERCTVAAPFNARIKQVSLEKDQYVMPGAGVLTLADDSILEIQVSLDSNDARKWLKFTDVEEKTAWLSNPENVKCKIRWTEDADNHSWYGILHRAVKFDQKTRTLTVAVRINAKDAVSENDSLPLVEGMFCLVEIPGKNLHDVVEVPRWAVTFDNHIYISVKSRLKTIPVEVARIEGDKAYISSGVNPGDKVIITRLVNPLEESLLDFAEAGSKSPQEAGEDFKPTNVNVEGLGE